MAEISMEGEPIVLQDNDVATAVFKSRLPLQPDDANDSLLMHCCAALSAVGNRALCPKELAELCMKRGWTCSGTQPFAIISSAIRAHLRRRHISTSNASNGLPPAQGMPAPLFVSYELTGPVAPEDVEAIGIIKLEKPAIKRGTLWYLSWHGTGFPTPFPPGRDPLGHLRNKTHNAPPPPPVHHHHHHHHQPSRHQVVVPSGEKVRMASPDRMATRKGARHSFSYQPVIDESEDIDAMGRGKRKRRASGIAGGEWESIALPSTSVGPNGIAMTAAVPRPTLPRINEEPQIATWSPRLSQPTSPVVKLKLKLPASSDVTRTIPAPAVPPNVFASFDTAAAPSSDDETADEMDEDVWQSRKRLRFRSGRDVTTVYRNPRPAFSASTSVFGDDDTASEDEDDGGSTKDFAEAMLRAADFDFEFDHAFSAPLQSGLAELGHLAIDVTSVSTPATTPRYNEEAADDPAMKNALHNALEQAIKNAPARHAASTSAAAMDEEDDGDDSSASTSSDESVAAALKGKDRKRAASAGALEAPYHLSINATLCPARPPLNRARSHSYEAIPPMAKRAASAGPPDLAMEERNPALPLPNLSVDSEVPGFSPSALVTTPPIEEDPPCQTHYGFTKAADAAEGGWREDTESHATSPSALAASPHSLSEEDYEAEMARCAEQLASRSVSPHDMLDEDVLSDGGASLVAESSLSLMAGISGSLLTSMDLDAPEATGLDVLDREFGPDDVLPSFAPPSFGNSAVSLFTSFLGAASVPVQVVGVRRDSSSSYDSVESGESADEGSDQPPARRTRSAAAGRTRRASPAKLAPPLRVSPRKRGGRRASVTTTSA